jgi:prepilin-type N-terminal cleavage/methylation domain-containing protein
MITQTPETPDKTASPRRVCKLIVRGHVKACTRASDATDMTHAHARRPAALPSAWRPGIGRVVPGGGSGRQQDAFSLIELVIVVTIIAIIASIAVRRLSRHAEQAGANGLAADLSVLQLAIERYRAEHGGLSPTQADVEAQLTKYTDGNGAISPTCAAPYIYRPYLRKIPPVPTGIAVGRTKVGPAPAADIGWVYTAATGDIAVNDTGP